MLSAFRLRGTATSSPIFYGATVMRCRCGTSARLSEVDTEVTLSKGTYWHESLSSISNGCVSVRKHCMLGSGIAGDVARFKARARIG